MIPACALYIHHNNDELTVRHYNLLRLMNPRIPVVPLSFGCGLPNRVVVKSYPLSLLHQLPRDEGSQWWHCDRLVYSWFASRFRVQAERYFIIESDTLCWEPLTQFYARVWHSAVAVVESITPADTPGYVYWPSNAQGRSLMALCPIAGIMLSHGALSAVVTEVEDERYAQDFSEVRLGTAVNQCGFRPVVIRPDIKDFIAFQERPPKGLFGIYHKVSQPYQIP